MGVVRTVAIRRGCALPERAATAQLHPAAFVGEIGPGWHGMPFFMRTMI